MSEKTLLVVDDEEGFGTFVAEVADGLGYDTRVTVSGREFTKACETEIPSVVVMDVIMPGMDGVELAGGLAEKKFDGHVVVVTGFAPLYADLVASLGSAGGIKSVTKLFKPVRIKALREALTFDEAPV
jgi:two-component system alkaline phosphatase synthesis response regulator PhoP